MTLQLLIDGTAMNDPYGGDLRWYTYLMASC